jgi:branched-chain amino acid transport system substrate-binding protein
VIGDYALNSSDILEQYGASLEGVVIVPAYPYEESAQLESFIEEYQKEYQSGFSSAAIQYYDLIRMIGEYSQDGNVTGTELMQLIKSESGYQGVSGTIRFDENGCLVTENCPLFICKNKEFVLYEE